MATYHLKPSKLFQPQLQAPVLVLPDQWLHYLSAVPQVPRPLKTYDADRRQKLLQLARLVLDTQQDESAARTVKYLVSLTDANPVPNSVPPLNWISQRRPGEFDGLITLKLNRGIGRIVPQMEFCARIQRPR